MVLNYPAQSWCPVHNWGAIYCRSRRGSTLIGPAAGVALGDNIQCRADHAHIAGAAAQMTAQHVAQRLFIWVGLPFKVIHQGHEHTRGAVAALQRMVLAKGFLQVGEFALAPGQPFQGVDAPSRRLDREAQA